MTRWRLAENGPELRHDSGQPTMGLLNANPFAEGIANLGAQVVAAAVLEDGWNVEFGFADTCSPASPFIANLVAPDRCPVLAFSIPFEDTYHHVPRMLRACGVTTLARDRAEDEPFVIAGGLALINPMPLAPFFDAMIIGEGREAIVAVNATVLDARARGLRRPAILELLAGVPHVFVPALYEFTFAPDGTVTRFTPTGGAPSEIHPGRPLDMTQHPITSLWTTERACYKYPDYYSVMVAMGCHLKCPFCVVGNVQGMESGRAANITRDTIVDLSIQRRRDYGTKLVKLFFASSFSAQSAIDPLSIKNLLDEMLQHDFQCRVGSLNVRQADDELLGLVRRAGQDRVTFAPETVESLRQSIGKPYSKDDKLIYIAERAGEHDLGLDLYTMLGVPGEEPRHVRQLARLIREVRSALAPHLSLEVSINPAFAKAQTPYERHPTLRPEETRRRFAYLRRQLGDETGIAWVSVISDPMTYYQPILSMGGPELAPVLMELSGSFAPSERQWRDAIHRLVPGGDERYFRERPWPACLPWQHIRYNDHRKLSLRLDAHRLRAGNA